MRVSEPIYTFLFLAGLGSCQSSSDDNKYANLRPTNITGLAYFYYPWIGSYVDEPSRLDRNAGVLTNLGTTTALQQSASSPRITMTRPSATHSPMESQSRSPTRTLSSASSHPTVTTVTLTRSSGC